jgi:hypothetical protein
MAATSVPSADEGFVCDVRSGAVFVRFRIAVSRPKQGTDAADVIEEVVRYRRGGDPALHLWGQGRATLAGEKCEDPVWR